jgi:uncharacterized protein (TIGR02246 family)
MPNDTRFLAAYAQAWNSHDLDAIIGAMTEDCVFISSDGSRTEGREAVRQVFAEIFTAFPNARWEEAHHFAAGDRGASEWIFVATAADGSSLSERGCDLFTFREGLIALKNTYLK